SCGGGAGADVGCCGCWERTCWTGITMVGSSADGTAPVQGAGTGGFGCDAVMLGWTPCPEVDN
ncbi:hypothetical protein, partial [Carbonactinospora thermoautotrophica]|uniref:hypothetical protein n=1 Tax=Carbonactinospora thermoautotrophica TaxID=1469144 RepID=UPI001E448B3C